MRRSAKNPSPARAAGQRPAQPAKPAASDPTRRPVDASTLFGGVSQSEHQSRERARREREAQET